MDADGTPPPKDGDGPPPPKDGDGTPPPPDKGQLPIPGHAMKTVNGLQKQNPKVEVGIVMKDGKVIHQQVGKSGTELEWGNLQKERKGAETLHTHPSNGEAGGAHSSTDVMNAIKDGQVATHVQGKDKVYTFDINNKNIDADYPGDTKRYELAREIQKRHEEIKLEKSQKAKDLEIKITMEEMKGKDRDKGLLEKMKTDLKNEKVKVSEESAKQLGKEFGKYITFREPVNKPPGT
jgi:hypothetical protein